MGFNYNFNGKKKMCACVCVTFYNVMKYVVHKIII